MRGGRKRDIGGRTYGHSDSGLVELVGRVGGFTSSNHSFHIVLFALLFKRKRRGLLGVAVVGGCVEFVCCITSTYAGAF